MPKEYDTAIGAFTADNLKTVIESGEIYWPTAMAWSEEAQQNIKWIAAYVVGNGRKIVAKLEVTKIINAQSRKPIHIKVKAHKLKNNIDISHLPRFRRKFVCWNDL